MLGVTLVVWLRVGSVIVTVIIGAMVFVVTDTAFGWVVITAVVRSLVGEVVVFVTLTVVSGAAVDLIRGDDDTVEVGTVEMVQN